MTFCICCEMLLRDSGVCTGSMYRCSRFPFMYFQGTCGSAIEEFVEILLLLCTERKFFVMRWHLLDFSLFLRLLATAELTISSQRSFVCILYFVFFLERFWTIGFSLLSTPTFFWLYTVVNYAFILSVVYFFQEVVVILCSIWLWAFHIVAAASQSSLMSLCIMGEGVFPVAVWYSVWATSHEQLIRPRIKLSQPRASWW